MIGAKEIMNNILFSISFQFNMGKQTNRHHNEISAVLRDWYRMPWDLIRRAPKSNFGFRDFLDEVIQKI